jgi:beta-glucosidase-like glycosyl hydrolase
VVLEIRAFYDTAGGDSGQAKSLEGAPFGLTYYAPNVNVMRDPRWGRNEEVGFFGGDGTFRGVICLGRGLDTLIFPIYI